MIWSSEGDYSGLRKYRACGKATHPEILRFVIYNFPSDFTAIPELEGEVLKLGSVSCQTAGWEESEKSLLKRFRDLIDEVL